jgi:protein-disulfide isomerase
MHRRIQLGANLALVVVALTFIVHVLWPGALPRLGERLIPALAAVPTPPRPVRPPAPVPSEPVSVAGAPLLGSPQAPVVLIEYSDFECPFCASFQAGTLQVLKAEYFDTGRAVLAFRHLPLPSIHPNAMRAAEAAACAGEQGKFWEMHDVVFKNRSALSENALALYATTTGADVGAWAACMAEGRFSATVAAEAAEANQLGLAGTPAFFVGVREGVGGVRVLSAIRGSRPIHEFRSALDAALAESDSK